MPYSFSRKATSTPQWAALWSRSLGVVSSVARSGSCMVMRRGDHAGACARARGWPYAGRAAALAEALGRAPSDGRTLHMDGQCSLVGFASVAVRADVLPD